MSKNTGGPAFPVPDTYHPNGQVQYGTHGMTLLDWYAGQESISDEDLSMAICEHYAGPRPHGDWKTNPVGWYEWEARWRAGVKYMRASAMLAEKARREAVVQQSSTTQDAGKMVWKQSPNMNGAIICETQFSAVHADEENVTAYGGYLVAESVPEEAKALIIRAPQLEAANRELVEALEACNAAFCKLDPAGGSDCGFAWASVQAVLAKHKGAA